MNKICGIYKITNTITGDFYIGSSKNIKHRWASHKCNSTWKKCPNNPLYKDMQKYGVDKFEFEIIAEVEAYKLRDTEQQFIELLKPTYNSNNANGWNVERRKKCQKKYLQSEKGKKCQKKYRQSEKGKKYHNKYQKSDKGKETHRKSNNKYNNQLCYYNGETLTLCALYQRFKRQGIDHPTLEAKKYLIKD